MTSLHLILDTSSRQSNQGSICNFLFHFDKINIESYKKIKLNSFYIQHESDAQKVFHDPLDNDANKSLAPLHVHCNLLNKDYNFFNGKKSDIMAVIYPTLHSQKAFMTNVLIRIDNSDFKLISTCSYVQLKPTHSNNSIVEKRGKFYIVYEIEFSQ